MRPQMQWTLSERQTRPLSAGRKENMTVLLQPAPPPRRALCAPVLSLAQGQRACAPRSVAAGKF